MEGNAKRRFQTKELAYMALFAVVLSVCSWLSIPAPIPFTLQTFGVFATLGLLGGRRSFFTIALYLLLGAVGVPVFSGFAGGPGVLFGMTGGYLWGFLFSALAYALITARFGEGLLASACAMLAGLLVCYAAGTAWFMLVYARQTGPIGLSSALGLCVLPFLVPDAVKLALAALLVKQLKPRVRL